MLFACRLLQTALALLLLAVPAQARSSPAKRVIDMLQERTNKVIEEAKAEEKLYDKHMCYCKSNKESLQKNIEDLTRKNPTMKSDINTLEISRETLEKELEKAKNDQGDAEQSAAKAESLRKKESVDNQKRAKQLTESISAVERALFIIKGGVSSFLQESTTADLELLRMLVQEKVDVDERRQREVVAFLQGGEGYEPSSGVVIGVLSQLLETLEEDLRSTMANENEAAKTNAELFRNKNGVVSSLTRQVQEKTMRLSEMQIDLVTLRRELAKNEEQLTEDKSFLATLQKTCEEKVQEYKQRASLQNEELEALAETIKMLDSDENRVLLKKTFGSGTSMLQMPGNEVQLRQDAADAISAAKDQLPSVQRPGLEFISLALKGKKIGLDGVIEMIQKLKKTLNREQEAEREKRQYCNEQYAEVAAKKDELENRQSETSSNIFNVKASLAIVVDAINEMENGIKELDKTTADTTELRKAEYLEYKDAQVQSLDTKDLIERAASRLKSFYDRGDVKTTGALFMEVSEHFGESPRPPPPEDFSSSAAAGRVGAGTSILKMLQTLAEQVNTEMKFAENAETNAQKEYEEFMKDSAAKRLEDSQALALKSGVKAEKEAELQSHVATQAATTQAQTDNDAYKLALDNECAWLLQHFQERSEARLREIDSLDNAVNILKNAEQEQEGSSAVSLVQIRAVSERRNLRGA
eukprot:TRINITY_DN27498_c0_g1_i1.p1 TRINITY_DN27498_c0_g1~~TRINITY_DN27498_c0_g1_i1.p1  ORF type:complete len:699 (-),score=210.76 TRINITY_DN27498_c0_g1_i1:52-2148(-)